MNIAVYYINGDLPQEADREEVNHMVVEMQERGLLPEEVTLRFFSDPNLVDRTELNAAAIYGDAILLPRMRGRGRVAPFLDFLRKTGRPLFIPEIPTFPHGRPLGLDGVREILAWNDRMKSLKHREAAEKVTAPRGGDRGHVPPPEVRAQANEARKQAAEDAARDRADEVLRAFTEAGTFNGAAKILNGWGITPTSGSGTWYGSTVRRVLVRLGVVEET